MGIEINLELEQYRKYIKSKLNKKRYIHSLGVAYTAASLAFVYDVDINKARIAGILHDNAKCYLPNEIIDKCQKVGIEITQYEIEAPELLHSKLGSYIASNELKIEDNDIINAICYHTTGRANMSLLERIIFVSDYIEPNRSNLEHLDKIRKLAFTNIDEAIVQICSSTIDYLNSKNGTIDPATYATYKYYKGVVENNDK